MPSNWPWALAAVAALGLVSAASPLHAPPRLRSAAAAATPLTVPLAAVQTKKAARDDHVLGRLIPGLAVAAADGLKKMNQYLGFTEPDITRLHMGHIHVCQPWENCTAHEEEEEKLLEAPITIAPLVMVNGTNGTEIDTRPARSCPAWGATMGGCECINTCECDTSRTCFTRPMTAFDEEDNETRTHPCGTQDLASTGKWQDVCARAPAAIPYPRLNINEPNIKGYDAKFYREMDADGNMRHLPKNGCFSRDFYCTTFPKFPGCSATKTYRFQMLPEQLELMNKCEALTDKGQAECEKEETCGEGKYGTCYPTCLYGEDSPWWFRELRGKQNMVIRDMSSDPAKTGNARMLPILQPSSSDYDPSLEVLKEPVKQSGPPTTPEPVSRAGDVGTGRSAGFVPASEVGKLVGSDMEAKGGFRPE